MSWLRDADDSAEEEVEIERLRSQSVISLPVLPVVSPAL